MLILGVLNSFGLWLIGIDYPVFWGFLGAFLAIIPYIGTAIGGLLPFLYALATTSTLWQPMAVIGWFVLVQQIEGNLITPKVLGSSVKVNPFAAIFALFFGGYLWGIPGLILAIFYMIFIATRASLNPELAPKVPDQGVLSPMTMAEPDGL